MIGKFLPDGPRRAATAQRAEAKQAIAAKYADQLATAGFFQRIRIRIAMRRELAKEVMQSRYSLWSTQ